MKRTPSLSDELKHRWYVLHTKSRFENVVHDMLRGKQLESFLPKMTRLSKRKDRRAMIQVPVFPGYVFVRTNLDPREHVEILKTTGAVRLIGVQTGPVPVPEKQIESIRIMTVAKERIHTGDRFLPGQQIMVMSGPFAGITGAFVRHGAVGRVVVYIQVLGRYAAVEVEEADVEILPEEQF